MAKRAQLPATPSGTYEGVDIVGPSGSPVFSVDDGAANILGVVTVDQPTATMTTAGTMNAEALEIHTAGPTAEHDVRAQQPTGAAAAYRLTVRNLGAVAGRLFLVKGANGGIWRFDATIGGVNVANLLRIGNDTRPEIQFKGVLNFAESVPAASTVDGDFYRDPVTGKLFFNNDGVLEPVS